MPIRWFSKDLPEQPIYIQGRPYKFDVIATEDPWLIGEFENAIATHSGGISEITKEQYEESLKKKTSTPSLPNFHRSAEILPHQFNRNPVARPAVVVGNPIAQPPPNLGPAEPITVTPPRVFMPKVSKQPTIKP